jgi:hypothetical protein
MMEPFALLRKLNNPIHFIGSVKLMLITFSLLVHDVIPVLGKQITYNS